MRAVSLIATRRSYSTWCWNIIWRQNGTWLILINLNTEGCFSRSMMPDKMADIFQTPFSNPSSCNLIKMHNACHSHMHFEYHVTRNILYKFYESLLSTNDYFVYRKFTYECFSSRNAIHVNSLNSSYWVHIHQNTETKLIFRKYCPFLLAWYHIDYFYWNWSAFTNP